MEWLERFKLVLQTCPDIQDAQLFLIFPELENSPERLDAALMFPYKDHVAEEFKPKKRSFWTKLFIMKNLLFALFCLVTFAAKAQTTTFGPDLVVNDSVSFTGVMQTNRQWTGCYILMQLGTVTGTTPTLSVQFQWSPDGGTTWISVGPALANLTTTNNTGAIFIYPTNFSSGGATGTALTTGATQTLLLNMPLPRYWRFNYTVGGTSPHFTINSIQANYIQ